MFNADKWKQGLKKNWLVCLVVLAELVVLLFNFMQDRAYRAPTILLSDSFGAMQDTGTEATTDGYVVQEGLQGTVLATRWLALEPGIYNVTASYLGGGEDVTIAFYKSTVAAGTVRLRQDMRAVTFQAYVPAAQEQATLRIETGGSGFTLQSLVLEYSNAYSWYHLLCMGLFFALADIVWLLWSRRLVLRCTPQAGVIALALVSVACLASLPVFIGNLIPGHDLQFHLNRIEGLSQAMASGQFPVRVQPFWLDGRGYAVSVFYGDLLLYIPALLRFFGVSVQGAYKCYMLAINLATTGISYYCLRKMLKNDWVALVGSTLYTLAYYRIVNMYLRAAVGEYTAMAFLPLVFYGLWRIFTQENDAKPARLIWLPAVLGFSGLIQSHLLSCEIVGALTLLTCIVFIRRTLRKNTFFPLVKTVAVTAALNLWFLVPFLDYMRGSYNFQTNGEGPQNGLQIYAGYLGQMLGLNISGNVSYFTLGLDQGTSKEMSFGIGAVLLLGALLFVACTIWQNDRESKIWRTGNYALWVGVLCVFLSSTLFPWDSLCKANALFKRVASLLQYVWRFLSAGTWLWVAAAACALVLLWRHTNLRNIAAAVLICLSLATWGNFMQVAMTESNVMFRYSAANLESTNVGSGEYLPMGTENEQYMGRRAVTTEGVELTKNEDGEENVTLDRLNATVPCSSAAGGTVTLPITGYPYYHAVDAATGAALPVDMDPAVGLLRVTLPAGYAGTFTAYYAEPWFWRVAELASLAAVFALAVYALRCKKHGPQPAAVTEKAEMTV